MTLAYATTSLTDAGQAGLRALAIGLAGGLGAIGAGVGIGVVFQGVLEATSRQPKLREEIVHRYRTNYGVEVDPETEAIATIGAKDALAHLLFAVIGPGDIVVSPNPCYPIHHDGVIMAEGNACMLPMPDPATFLDSLEELCRRGQTPPKMILVSFPHNPTTHCVDLEFFRTLVALAAEHGTMIVHGFAYADICFDG